VTFSAPKSVSILAAVADPSARAEVLAAHDAAVVAVLGYVQRHAQTRFRVEGVVVSVDAEGNESAETSIDAAVNCSTVRSRASNAVPWSIAGIVCCVAHGRHPATYAFRFRPTGPAVGIGHVSMM